MWFVLKLGTFEMSSSQVLYSKVCQNLLLSGFPIHFADLNTAIWFLKGLHGKVKVMVQDKLKWLIV